MEKKKQSEISKGRNWKTHIHIQKKIHASLQRLFSIQLSLFWFIISLFSLSNNIFSFFVMSFCLPLHVHRVLVGFALSDGQFFLFCPVLSENFHAICVVCSKIRQMRLVAKFDPCPRSYASSVQKRSELPKPTTFFVQSNEVTAFLVNFKQVSGQFDRHPQVTRSDLIQTFLFVLAQGHWGQGFWKHQHLRAKYLMRFEIPCVSDKTIISNDVLYFYS